MTKSDKEFITEQQQAMAEAQELIHQGQIAFQENNISEATDHFIDGYWKFRQVLTDIWYRADPEGGTNSINYRFTGFYNGKPYRLYKNASFQPCSNIWLRCWLNNNSLINYKKESWSPSDLIYYKKKSHSKYIKKMFIQSFNNPQIKSIQDCGNWLQNNFCKPVSMCLLEQFKSLPNDAHNLIKLFELYKCYIESDFRSDSEGCFGVRAPSMLYNFKNTYDAFYQWFFNMIKSLLKSSENSDHHTVLLSIFYNWNAEMSDFVDTTSLSNERIRGLGGYQIDSGPVLHYFQDPNIQSKLIIGNAPQSIQLAKQIKAFGTGYAVLNKEAIELVFPGVQ